MKATGIVRKVDDLGRIVIPKEIRKNLKIREGDPVEIFVSQGENIVLKKYSLLNGYENEFNKIASVLANKLNTTVLISDNDKVIASAGPLKDEYHGKDLSHRVRNILQERRTTHASLTNITTKEIYQGNAYIFPLIVEGDLFGGIIVLLNDIDFTESYKVVMEVMGNYIIKRLES